MTFEEKKNPLKKTGHDMLKGAAFGAAVLGAGAMGVEAGARNIMEQINSHALTPAAVEGLQQETGASDEEIAKLEARIKPLLIQELKRSMNRT